MFYENFQFWGMHLIWWVIWGAILIWIYPTPYDMPGQRKKRDTPIDALKKRFALGEIDEKEFLEKRTIIER
jgi:putative membrane protein